MNHNSDDINLRLILMRWIFFELSHCRSNHAAFVLKTLSSREDVAIILLLLLLLLKMITLIVWKGTARAM